MRIKCVVFCLLLITVFTGLFAQENDNWFYNKPIRDIRFEGLVNVEVTDVTAVTNRFIGKQFTDELYSDLLSKIYALEFFTDDIGIIAVPADEKYDAVVIRFTVVELPIITSIEFKGNSSVRKMEIEEAISLKARQVYNKAKVIMDERVIRDLYLEKGFTNIKVSSSTKESKNEVSLVFNIEEGNATVVDSIQFEGNQVVSAKTLRSEMELAETNLFKDGAFEEAKLETDKQKIVSYYLNRGYADASIIDVRREVKHNEKKNREELTLVFVIREGTQYTYEGIAITGNIIFDTETLQNCIKLKKGALFSQLRIQEGLMAISDLYYENGYTSNQFIPQVQKDNEKKTIAYTLQIVERDRSHVENIILKGNVKTKDYVILREIPIEAGDIFSKAKVTNGLRNLYNTQYFSALVPDVQPGSEENLVNLVFSLEEQSTTSLEFGVTFSGVTEPGAWPISLFAKWQDSNFLGTGKTISASVVASKTTQSLSLGFSQRWLWGQPISISFSGSIEHSDTTALQKMYLPTGYDDDSYYFSYENWTMSVSASLGRRWTPDFAIISLTGGLSSSLLRNIYDADMYIPVDETISEYYGSWGYGNTLYSSISIDDRDVNFDPSKGWFASQRFAWTGLLPGVETQFFFRSDTKLEGYLTLMDFPVTKKWNLKMVLAAYSGFSFLLPTEDTNLSTRNRLYIDGMFNGRGWTDHYYDRGEVLWSNFLELRIPIVPGIVALDIFADAALLQSNLSEMDLGIENWSFSFGPGIRFCLPQFPLRLLFTNPFYVKDGLVQWGQDRATDSGRPDWQFVLSFNLANK